MYSRLLVLVPLVVCTAACSGTSKINGSIDVIAGQPLSDAHSINGSIHVAPKAHIEDGSSINGSITLGDHASAESLHVINGRITVDTGARVTQDIKSVNGAVTLSPGASVVGRVSSVNGHIRIAGASVGGGVETDDADVDVTGDAHIDGGLLVDKPGSGRWFHTGRDHVPRIVIGPGATVNGTLRFERPVTLYISDRVAVGTIVGATPITFSGDQPPSS